MTPRPRNDKRKSYRPIPELTDEQLGELASRYWHTGETRKSIIVGFGLNDFEFSKLLPRLAAHDPCPYCGGVMEWKIRQARDRSDAGCASCRHRTGSGCGCDRCRAAFDAERRRREAEMAAEREAALRDWLGRRDDAELAAIVKQLSVPQRIYLDGLRRNWAGNIDFAEIAQAVGIQVLWVETYLLRYEALGLVFVDDRRWHLHPAILDGRVPIIP